MNTSSPEALTIDSALSDVPKRYRSKLVKNYTQLKQAFFRGDHDSCGTRAGRFCETLIRLLQFELENQSVRFGVTINMYTEAARLAQLPRTSGPEAFRIFIPRAMCFLYTLRNKRGFAHVGGDIDSDPIDAATCVRVADWCLCELIRIKHSLSLEEAQRVIDAIATKEVPEVWSVAGKRRVLKLGLKYKEQTLLLLYSEVEDAVLIEDLFDWVEYSRFNDFKKNVLAPLHEDRLIEWDKETGAAILSPTGIEEVEEKILR